MSGRKRGKRSAERGIDCTRWRGRRGRRRRETKTAGMPLETRGERLPPLKAGKMSSLRKIWTLLRWTFYSMKARSKRNDHLDESTNTIVTRDDHANETDHLTATRTRGQERAGPEIARARHMTLPANRTKSRM